MLEIFYSRESKDLSSGRLWRVTAPNGGVNYLLGTVHLNFPILTNGTPELNTVFNESNTFLFEMPNIFKPFDETFSSLKMLLNRKLPDTVIEKLHYIPDLYTQVHFQLCKMANEVI